MFEDVVFDNLTRIWNFPNNKFREIDGKKWTNINPDNLDKRLHSSSGSTVVALNNLKNNKKIDLIREGRVYLFSLSQSSNLTDTISFSDLKGITVEQAIEQSKEWDSSLPFGGGHRYVTPTVAPYGKTTSEAPYYFHNGQKMFRSSILSPERFKGWLSKEEIAHFVRINRELEANYVPTYDEAGNEVF